MPLIALQDATATSVGVAIVSYNTVDLLRDCLQSLDRSGLAVAVVVVDNGSTDDSVAMIETAFPTVCVIVPGANLGFARGTNLAMQRLLAEAPGLQHILMLNPDTVVHAGALESLVAFAEAHPRVGVVSPRLVNVDGSLQRGVFRFPTPLMTLFDLFPPGEVTPGRFYDSWWHGRYPQEAAGDAPFAVDHPLGAAMLTRVAVLAEVGMLDEEYFMYVEEVDWCMRVRTAGWAIWQQPAAVVTHVGGASSRQFRAAMTLALWRSRVRYWQRWCSPRALWWHRTFLHWGIWRMRWVAARAHRRGLLSTDQYHELLAVYRTVQFL
ncbi:MAG: hypothetical protein RLY87_2376 [Chloroflexota bacterium]|jgi:GT2 family glycosyltransferase